MSKHYDENEKIDCAAETGENTAEDMAAFFDRRADGYEEHMAGIGFDREEYGRLSRTLPETVEPLRILDLGCGTGMELRALFERVPNAKVTCLDLSQGMLEILSRNYKDRASQLRILQESFVTWNYPIDSFDAVISSMAMHHFLPERKTQIYRKIHRCLKPGGRYAEHDFIVDGAQMRRYRAEYERRIEQNGGEDSGGTYHIDIPMTTEIQIRLFTLAGFDDVRVVHEDIREEGSNALITARK